MKIKKGDILVVKDAGFMYTTYIKMFEDLKFKNIELNRNINEGEIVVVFNIGKHEEQKIKLYAVTTFDGRQGLFSKKAFYKK
jgi:hypothetical protein